MAMMGLPVIIPENFKDITERYGAQDLAEFLPAHWSAEQVEGYRPQQLVHVELMQSTNVVFNEMMLTGPAGGVQNPHPISRGDIILSIDDPKGTPIVNCRAASNPIDIEVTVETVKFARRSYTEVELAQYEAVEILPGPDVVTDADVEAWCREQITPSVFHLVGTTAMMPRKWGGVVDEDRFVYGTKNLRVVDFGIQATLVGATTCQTVYAVAEKIAERILEQAAEDSEQPPKFRLKKSKVSKRAKTATKN